MDGLAGGVTQDAAVEVFCSRADGLGPESVRFMRSALPDVERDRFDRLPTSAALRFVVGRTLLRLVLARHVGPGGQPLSINASPDGKLFLDPPVLAFNLAHAGDFVVLATTTADAVGVDVEPIRPVDHGLAARFLLSDELRRVDEARPQERAELVTRMWVVKEACIKALGQTLSTIRQFEVGSGQAGTTHEGAVRWRLVDTWPGVAAAVAVPGASDPIRASVMHLAHQELEAVTEVIDRWTR